MTRHFCFCGRGTKSETLVLLSEPAMTLRRQTPPMLRILSPPKVRGVCFLKVNLYVYSDPLPSLTPLFLTLLVLVLFVTQRSPFIWMNQMLSQLRAVTMESPSDSSPLGLLVAESPSMSLHFTNRRRRLRTKDAGIVQLSSGECLHHTYIIWINWN